MSALIEKQTFSEVMDAPPLLLIDPPDDAVVVVMLVAVVVVTVGGTIAAVPVPDNADVSGLVPSPPVKLTCKVVERAPVALGVKVSVKVQESPALSVAPQVCEPLTKSVVFPVTWDMTTEVMLVAEPLESVNVTGEEDWPTTIEPKSLLLGESETAPEAAGINVVSKGCG